MKTIRANNIIAANVEPMTIPAISPLVRPSSSPSEFVPTVTVGITLGIVGVIIIAVGVIIVAVGVIIVAVGTIVVLVGIIIIAVGNADVVATVFVPHK